MRTRSNPQINGTDKKTDFYRLMRQIVQEELQFFNTPTIKAQVTTRGIRLKAKIPPPGGSGWNFANPIELGDPPYPGFPAQTVIHIQGTSSIATAGIVDAGNPGGGVIMSPPGLWVCSQAVPAQRTVGGVDMWNLPQLPLPNPDNWDDPSNFWVVYLADGQCFGT